MLTLDSYSYLWNL